MPTQVNGFGPFDDNIFNWSQEERDRLVSIPSNLEEALFELEQDYEFLIEGDVFNTELIESWVSEKMKEVRAVRNRPHPFEMNLYYFL